MKAVLCLEPGHLEVVDRPPAENVPDGWVRLAVSHVGICGTDYHIFAGKHPFLKYPRVMGHEISATVIAGGRGTAIAPGTSVVVNPYLSCGNCVACRNGKPNCCTAIQVLGVHTDGAFCEEIVVPEANLYPAHDLTPEAAATVEFLAIGAHAVRRASAGAGSRALVIGAGPIGLGTAIFSRIAGHQVTLVDTSTERLDFAARKLGFAEGIVAGADMASRIADATGRDGFDVVFDATGHGGSMQAAFAYVAHGGILVFVSVVKDEIRFSDPEFHKREMTLIGSRNATREDFDHVVASIASGLVPVEALITHRTTLEGAVADLPRWAEEKAGLVKAIVKVAAA
ncbi:zinc-binding alcohol dehydrogenase family protein [Ensifer adhaerens]|uniref:zinc-binding alcohol dehydrogenase family protein n=1 Tax=Ensifer adhaerens TaxID=106592 RepID=UPI001CBC6B30|nr:zinc-binding alcohol dehydrogenase family protein [Ensifer adhaerens]MBZ7923776.1 zinc-binding alcohol dehydrogenase family protein [Ensifer adhaerens]UAX92320.1 zinc-binding alcohol dehydrogenase family protein [Ensifer adhaerens]UAX99952.1 zinc-binding alcohol dehydrogenase family protein [Ensifer adhaerens]UAY07336.1 zinc-binding alcohol dehydrogenase family protein [Ensifer adhaerens]